MKRAVALALLALLPGAALAAGDLAQSVSIVAYPTVVATFDPVVVSGAIDPAREGELVTVEGRECGVPGSVFRGLVAAQSGAGGAWSVDYRPRSKTVLRAVWGKDVSREVTVLRRAFVTLVPRPDGRLRVSHWGVGRIQGKRALVQRLDPRTQTWRTVRAVVLRSNYGEYAEAHVKVKVPRGTTLRATLPAAQAKPCYLAGFSATIRT